MPEANPQTDISAIKGYIQKNDKRLIGETMQSLDFIKDLTGTIRNLRTERHFNRMTVDTGVRQYNSEIDKAKGGRKWSRRTITRRYGMKILSVKVQDERQTFQSEQMAPGAKREPFAAWKWGQDFAKIGEELNDNFYDNKYIGDIPDFDPALTYAIEDHVYYDDGKRGAIVYECISATNAGESPETHPAKWEDVDSVVLFDGPGTIIKEGLANSEFSAFSGGAYDELNAYDAYMDQWNALPEKRKNKRPTALASYDSVQDLVTQLNKKFGTGAGIKGEDIEQGREFVLKNTGGRLKIKPVTWMKNSRRIVMGDPKNLVPGIDMLSDMNKVSKVVETLHGYDAIVNFMLTFQIKDVQELHVNNQE